MDLTFLHAADIHLDSPMRGLARYEGAPVDELRGATRRAFANLVDRAIADDVAFVLLAGDLYDGDWQDYNTGLFFSQQMRRLNDAGIRAFVIAGNHDAASQITKALDPPPNVHVFATGRPETLVLEDHGVAIHGQGFAQRVVDADLTARYPAAVPGLFNIGLLHTSLDGRPGHDVYAPTSVTALRTRGYQYWALGHVHAREVVSEDPWVVFPGNLQGRHIGETGARGATRVQVVDGAVAAAEHVPLDVIRWQHCRVDVSGCDVSAETLDAVRDALSRVPDALDGRPGALRVELHGATAAHGDLHRDRERLRHQVIQAADELFGGQVWVEKLVLDTTPLQDADTALARDDAFGLLLRTVHDLTLADADVDALVAELAGLSDRLSGLPGAEGTGALADPAAVHAMLDDVRAELLERLLVADGTDGAAGAGR